MRQAKYQSEWYQKNRERCLQKDRDYYQKHKKEILIRQRKYEREHKDEIAERKRKYREGKYQHSPIGTCPLCGNESVKLMRDHDHVTGKPRELICFHCNLALGHAKDSVKTLKAMATYLEEHKDGIEW